MPVLGTAAVMLSGPGSSKWLPRAVILVDQGVSSVSNLLVVVLVARVLSPSDFGHFALGYAILTVTLGLSRAYFGSRISLAKDPASARQLTAALVAGMLVVSPVVALAVFAVSTVATNGQAQLIVLIVALASPVVCMQDALRFGAASGGRPWVALLSDTVWVVIMTLPFLLGIRLQASAAVALWASAASLALVVALISFGARPRLRPGLRELRRREDVGAAITVGAVATTSATLLVLLVVTNVLGPAATGSLRGASTAMGPVNVLLAFSALGITPVLVRRARAGDRAFCALVAAAMMALVLAWGAVLLILPDSVGAAAFGSSWPGIRSVLAWTVAEYVWVAASAAAILGLKVRRQVGGLVRTRAIAAGTTVVAGTIAATTLRETVAVAGALAASAFLTAAVSWLLLLRTDGIDRPDRSGPRRDLLEHGSA